MLEKDIENLIAKYPIEFFPKSEFELIGQQYKLGNCRADIVFKDKFERFIIIEVKRGILSREASGQIMEYYGRLKQEMPTAIIELILCANNIPNERRIFLEKVGIECKELGICLITQVAEKYKYQLLDDIKEKKEQELKKLNEIILEIPDTQKQSDSNVWIFQANPDDYDILNALSDETIGDNFFWSVRQKQYKDKIKKGQIGLIWMSGSESGIYAITSIISNPENVEETQEEYKHWKSDKKSGREYYGVEMTIKKRLLNNPILRKDLKKIEGLRNMRILKVPQGTNFPVTDSEWKIILDLIKQQK